MLSMIVFFLCCGDSTYSELWTRCNLIKSLIKYHFIEHSHIYHQTTNNKMFILFIHVYWDQNIKLTLYTLKNCIELNTLITFNGSYWRHQQREISHEHLRWLVNEYFQLVVPALYWIRFRKINSVLIVWTLIFVWIWICSVSGEIYQIHNRCWSNKWRYR